MRCWCGRWRRWFGVERLGMAEGAAYKRVWAARVGRRFPLVLDMIARGEIHLTGVHLLARHLNEENHAALLARAAGKTKRAIEKLVAEIAPRADVPSRVAALPRRAGQSPSDGQPADHPDHMFDAAVSGDCPVPPPALAAGPERGDVDGEVTAGPPAVLTALKLARKAATTRRPRATQSGAKAGAPARLGARRRACGRQSRGPVPGPQPAPGGRGLRRRLHGAQARRAACPRGAVAREPPSG